MITLTCKTTSKSFHLNGKIISSNSNVLVVDEVPLCQLGMIQHMHYVDGIADKLCIIDLNKATFISH